MRVATSPCSDGYRARNAFALAMVAGVGASMSAGIAAGLAVALVALAAAAILARVPAPRPMCLMAASGDEGATPAPRADVAVVLAQPRYVVAPESDVEARRVRPSWSSERARAACLPAPVQKPHHARARTFETTARVA